MTRLTPPELRAWSDSLLWKPSTCVRASGKSIGTVAKDLGLTETAVRAWVRQAEVDRGGGPVGALTIALLAWPCVRPCGRCGKAFSEEARNEKTDKRHGTNVGDGSCCL